jgi:hypothetical protein
VNGKEENSYDFVWILSTYLAQVSLKPENSVGFLCNSYILLVDNDTSE